MSQGPDYAGVVRVLRGRTFAVLSTADATGRPHSAGVVYGVSASGGELYVMTRRHLRKARDVAQRPEVSLLVPLTRRLLWFVPPACVELEGTADILDGRDPGGVRTFRGFTLGRRILAMYGDLERRGDRRTCFLRIRPRGELRTYMLGHSLWDAVRRMEAGARKIPVPEAVP